MTVDTTVVEQPSAARGFGWSAGANIALRLGNFCVGVLMARLLAPEQFGIFAVALTVWTLLGTLAEFGFGTDLVRASAPLKRAAAVGTLGLISCGLISLSMALLAPLLAVAFDTPEATPVVRLMAVALAIFGLSIVPAALLQREYRQGRIFAVNGMALILSTAVMIPLGVAGLGPYALALGQIATQVATVIGLHVAARYRPRFGWNSSIAAESFRFCAPLAGANLLSWVLMSVDNLIVARTLTAVDLGLYALAFNVSSWPMNALGQAVRVIALPSFARHESAASPGATLEKVIKPLWPVALVIGVLLATGARPGIEILYGRGWSGASVPLVGLGLFGAIRIIFDLIATFLIAIGHTREVLVVQIVWLVAMVPLMYLGVRWFGLAGAGVAHIVVALAITLPAYIYFLRRASVRVRQILRGAIIPTIAILPLAAASWFVCSHISSPWLAIAAASGMAIVLYALPMSPWWLRSVKSLRAIPRDSAVRADVGAADMRHAVTADGLPSEASPSEQATSVRIRDRAQQLGEIS